MHDKAGSISNIFELPLPAEMVLFHSAQASGSKFPRRFEIVLEGPNIFIKMIGSAIPEKG
jgi:hypothetical protein